MKSGEVVVDVAAPDEPRKAIFFARKKSDVFKRAFRTKVEVVWKALSPSSKELVGAGADV